jgi:peroxiredoxin (alkyl hydroperoxide reductase subunit C)
MTQSTIPTLGAPAPDFTLPSTAGRDVTLSALRGRNVLLAFFPLAFTSTCTAELCEFSTDYAQFERADTVVLPISVDSVPTLKAFKAQERMTVDLLSDFRRDVSRAYGVLLEDKFFANRAYILIDREGRVRWTHVESQLGHKRATAELVAAVAAVS